VMLAAVLLDARSTWSLAFVTCLAFAALTTFYRPLGLSDQHFADPFTLYIAGTFICFLLNAILLVVFVTQINRNLREHDADIATLRQQAVEEDHIVRMGLLASGAAHELGTPLAAMSVILNDWRHVPALTSDPEVAEDLVDMGSSLQRCKSIVTNILLSAGEARGEGSSATTINAFIGELIEEWRVARSFSELSVANSIDSDIAIASDVALKQVVFNVLDNALEASPNWVRLTVKQRDRMLLLRVEDKGHGFAPEMLAQVGTPYQSTKGRPGGGLGLFLVVNVVRKLGGKVAVENRSGGGASVTLKLPLSALAIGGKLGE
jgi:two-component system, sensor histidine kinase RegB